MTRILIVEDEPGIALGLKHELMGQGYTVAVAQDGQAGLDLAFDGSFDLILLDIVLPKKDGYTVCRELRHGGVHTPVIMLTARGLETDKILGLDLGADDYISKPYSPAELLARVRSLLRRGEGGSSEIYRFGLVEVDFTRAELRKQSKVIETTPLEFKLLSTFVRRRGCILTREQLLDEVWGRDSSPTDRVVDQHVMNLRRKIEADPQKPCYLVSKRGVGYRFDG